MAHRIHITIHLDSFEGPLDLLLYLIQSHELDISKVSIGAVTDQYLSHVRLMQELNFDMASEFLLMAATLLHWKSKALLPQEVDPNTTHSTTEEDGLSPEQLIHQLLEHQRFLAAGEELAQLPRLGEDIFARSNLKPPISRVWKEMNLSDLVLSFQETLSNSRKRTQILKKETVSLTDKIIEFSERLEIGKIIDMRSLIPLDPSRAEVVVTFLASLELSRLKKMKLYQEQIYDPIYVELLQSLKNLDFKLAIGFEVESIATSTQEQEQRTL